jgi:hypothetical protein
LVDITVLTRPTRYILWVVGLVFRLDLSPPFGFWESGIGSLSTFKAVTGVAQHPLIIRCTRTLGPWYLVCHVVTWAVTLLAGVVVPLADHLFVGWPLPVT